MNPQLQLPAHSADRVPFLPTQVAQALEELTSQERKVLAFTIAELSCKEIAQELSVSTETVKKHRKNIVKKLGVKGKTEFRRLLRQLDASTPKIPPTYPFGGIETA